MNHIARSSVHGRRLPPRAILLLVLCALPIPGSVVWAHPLHRTRPLFQVTSKQWRQAITQWTSYPVGSWTVHAGALTNKLTGEKLCGGGTGPGSCSWHSIIAASYHIPATRYAVDVVIRIQGSHGESDMGAIFLSPSTSAGPVLWLTMGDNGLQGTCPSNPPMLVGNPPNPMEPCGWPVSAIQGPRSFMPPMDDGWHHYRLQVRGKQYHLFIDGHQKEVIHDPRPAVGPGVVPGFYANGPTSVLAGAPHNRIWVQSVTISALPPSGHL